MEFFSGQGDQGSASVATAGEGIVYYPTLLIGIGGTGAQVLHRVKKQVQDRLGGRSHLHRFLFIDTDAATFANKPGYPPIQQPEKLLIGVDSVQSYLDFPHLHKEIAARFPSDLLQKKFVINLAKGNGAGQIRGSGGLAFALDLGSIETAIANAYNDLVRISERANQELSQVRAGIKNQVLIYIVGSFAGGTGSGCFLDVAAIATEVCRAWNPYVVGMFALPNASFDEACKKDPIQMRRMRANAYAALKELQFVQDAAPDRKIVEYNYGPQRVIRLMPEDRPFQLTYLVQDANKLGRLSNIDEVFELMARSVFQEVGSRFGTSNKTFESNNHVMSGVDPCPETHKGRLMGTVATSSLVYPAERVASYCTYRILREVVNDHLLGMPPAIAEIEKSVTSFLSAQHFDDRAPSNQLLERLLLDPERNEVVSSARFGISKNWGAKYEPKEFSENIKREWDQFLTMELPKIVKLVKDAGDEAIGRRLSPPRDILAEALEKYAFGVAESYGVSGVSRHLDELKTVLENIRSQLVNELNTWQRVDKNAFAQDLDSLRDKLAQIKFPKLTKKDDTLKVGLVNLYNDMVAQELWAVARPAAIDLVKAMTADLGTIKAGWDSLAADLQALLKETANEAGRLETHAAKPESRFAVEQEVTKPGYEQKFFQGAAYDVKQQVGHIVKDFGTREELYRWMLGTEARNRISTVGRKLALAIHKHIGPPILQTNIVDFIERNPDEVLDTLEAKLNLTFKMCQPFWDVRVIKGGLVFPEFLGISVAHIMQDNKLVPPPIVKTWGEQNVSAKDVKRFESLASDVPYEITLGRRTFGARAYYLASVVDWREIYRVEKETARSQKYMMETHGVFTDIPDLFPEDTRPASMFALGVAMGFIVTKGDWYYLALDKSGEDIRVLYPSQAPTIFGVGTDTTRPENTGLLIFALSTARPATARRLGQGREVAMQDLADKPVAVDLISQAVDEYHQAVGNVVFKRQLEAYKTAFLTPKEDESAYKKELDLIEQKINSIGK